MAVANSTGMTREEYRRSVRENAPGNFVCINCEQPSYRRISGTNKAKGSESKYCCMACRVEHSAKLAEQVRLVVARVRAEIKGIRRLGKSSYKPKKKRCQCNKCGAEYVATLGGGLHKQLCDKCITENRRESKRTEKAKRRAVCKGALAESVKPFAVFDRDKWRCRLCGRKTPKSKRGTYSDDAPELDHIVPISKGGQHTYLNTQCACRRCNAAKSDRPMGQMLLIG